ncbi:MAG: 4'-phosphopantetheinyl transferase family protein [Solirubrobacteraceae bacterium]
MSSGAHRAPAVASKRCDADPLVLKRCSLHLWLALAPRVTSGETAACRALMSEDEREREARFRRERDRRLYCVARSCTRSVLSRYLACDPSELRFSTGPAGKPTLTHPAQSALAFSLSPTPAGWSRSWWAAAALWASTSRRNAASTG